MQRPARTAAGALRRRSLARPRAACDAWPVASAAQPPARTRRPRMPGCAACAARTRTPRRTAVPRSGRTTPSPAPCRRGVCASQRRHLHQTPGPRSRGAHGHEPSANRYAHATVPAFAKNTTARAARPAASPLTFPAHHSNPATTEWRPHPSPGPARASPGMMSPMLLAAAATEPHHARHGQARPEHITPPHPARGCHAERRRGDLKGRTIPRAPGLARGHYQDIRGQAAPLPSAGLSRAGRAAPRYPRAGRSCGAPASLSWSRTRPAFPVWLPPVRPPAGAASR